MELGFGEKKPRLSKSQGLLAFILFKLHKLWELTLPASMIIILFLPTKPLIVRALLWKLLSGGSFETRCVTELWGQSGSFSLKENCFQKGVPPLSGGSHLFGFGMQIWWVRLKSSKRKSLMPRNAQGWGQPEGACGIEDIVPLASSHVLHSPSFSAMWEKSALYLSHCLISFSITHSWV